jgi:uncharacterized protein
MPVQPTYPGVYINEISSGVRTITGVSTSIAAFVDYFKTGPRDKATQILSVADFERIFGGLDSQSEASYAIQHFFQNGGQQAWVVRALSGSPAKATVDLLSSVDGSPALTLSALSEGAWGNSLRARIDYATQDPAQSFNLTVSSYITSNGKQLLDKVEVFRSLSMVPADARYVQTVVNDENSGSKLVTASATGSAMPLQNGTVSGDLSGFPLLSAASPELDITIGAVGTATAKIQKNHGTLEEARSALEEAIRASKPESPAFALAKVEVFQKRLKITAGPVAPDAQVKFALADSDPTAAELKLTGAAQAVKVLISGDISALTKLSATAGQVNVTIGAEGPLLASFLANPNSPASAQTELEKAIRAASNSAAFKNARVMLYQPTGEARLLVVPGVAGQTVSFEGTAGDSTTVSDLKLDSASSRASDGVLSGDLAAFHALTMATGSLLVTIGGDGPFAAKLAGKPTDLASARTLLEKAIRAAHSSATFSGALVAEYSCASEARLAVFAGNSGGAITFSPAPTDPSTVGQLRLDSAGGVTANVQEYLLGVGAPISGTGQGGGTAGSNGSPPDAAALIGSSNGKTGIYALKDADLFNILCIPRTASVAVGSAASLTGTAAASVISVAESFCLERHAMFLVDTPNDITGDVEIKDWLEKNDTLRGSNAALYFPRVKIADPLNEFRLRSFGASGTVAGLYARIDANRGVWKAPAGTEANLSGVQALDCSLTDMQNGVLNQLGINCLRSFPVYGNICWGARTLEGADAMASEWKYVPVRRLALFLEESLFRGTKWVVFEPNDEPLWGQIRLNIGAFLHGLFRQGAFQGVTPKEAYFVKCDSETTTQDDINKGVVNILVGFAPLKPAEFVIITLQQMAGQIQV